MVIFRWLIHLHAPISVSQLPGFLCMHRVRGGGETFTKETPFFVADHWHRTVEKITALDPYGII